MKVYQLINKLKKLNKNARIILDRTSGDLFDVDYEKEINEAIILTSEVAGKCKRCGHKIVIERDVKEYPFLCPSCQENMFSSEVKMNKVGKEYYEKWNKHRPAECDFLSISHSRFDVRMPNNILEHNKRFFVKNGNEFLEFELKYIHISYRSLIKVEIEGNMANSGTNKIEIAHNGVCSSRLFETEADIRMDNSVENTKINLAVEIAKLGYDVYKSQNGDVYVNLYKWNGQKPIKFAYNLKEGFRMTYSYDESFSVKFNVSFEGYKSKEECAKNNELIIKRL